MKWIDYMLKRKEEEEEEEEEKKDTLTLRIVWLR